MSKSEHLSSASSVGSKVKDKKNTRNLYNYSYITDTPACNIL